MTTTLRLPLEEGHASHGATFQQKGDWRLPYRFSDPIHEYEAAHKHCTLIDVSHWGRYILKGPRASEFLSHMFTNDCRTLSAGGGQLTSLLNRQGGVRSLFPLYHRGWDYVSFHWPPADRAFQEDMVEFLSLTETQLYDIRRDWGCFFVMGPESADVLMKAFRLYPKPPIYCQRTLWRDHDVFLFSFPYLGVEGTLLLFPKEASQGVWDALLSIGASHRMLPMGMEALDMLRVEEGYPVAGIDTDPETTPQDAGVSSALRAAKARQFFGGSHAESSQRLVHLRCQKRPVEGQTLYRDGQPVGTVRTACFSVRFEGPAALALVQKNHASPQTRFLLSQMSRSFSAEVVWPSPSPLRL